MDHSGSHGSHASRHEGEFVDLGNEPPLSVDGDDGQFVDRRRVSVQWFSGTILTGLCGAALMGGAVFTSLGSTNFAALPERMETALRGALGGSDRNAGARKSDRLPSGGESNVLRQVLRDTRMSRVGNHEVARVRTFIRVAGNLSMTTSELSANIPPFNPQRMLADSGGGSNGEAPAAEPSAEVAFTMRDLIPLLPRLQVALLTSADQVTRSVREVAEGPSAKPTARDPAPEFAALNAVTGMKLAYAVDARPSDPYAGFEARIVPENVTLLPKTKTETTGGNAWTERVVPLKKGDSIATALRDFGATPDEIKSILVALGQRGREPVKDGQKLKILPAPIPNSSRLQAVRVVLANDLTIDAVVALADSGKYVAVDVSNAETVVAEAADDDNDDGTGTRLYQSIYETALRNQVPRPIVDEMIRVYSYDVDFQRKVQPGDSFEVLFAGEEDTPAADANRDVLFAALTVGGDTKKFYRYQSTDDGVTDYYDETGKSAKKFLVRKPVATAIMRSSFGVRHHPILGYTKMHTGVDWAAPTGTPIYASGNGTVEKAGWESGYGKFVLIKHANGYETAYGHMTAFARGIDEGVRVRQGQIIGFVGSTGLSTGAHVHYEIRINGRFVDPMRIKLPRGRVLDGPLLTTFERERDRLDNMMSRRAPRVADSTPVTTPVTLRR